MIRAPHALVVLLSWAVLAHAEPRIEWVNSGGRMFVEVSGLDEASVATLRRLPSEKWSEVLAVRVQQDAAGQMLGEWKIDPNARALRFTPRFLLTPGVAYRAEFAGRNGSDTAPNARHLLSTFTMPVPPAGPATVVAGVFPSGPEVPENLLKFYLHFSAPMSRGHIYDHIHLRDEKEKDIELPFLEIDEELWDPEMKRLTLFIDPGRIKRGVRPLEEIGPALVQGHRFTLVIDAAWLDATGRPLAQNYRHSFQVDPPARQPINPREWKLAEPASVESPLEVTFPEPMDHALALRLLRVVSDDGRIVEGAPELLLCDNHRMQI